MRMLMNCDGAARSKTLPSDCQASELYSNRLPPRRWDRAATMARSTLLGLLQAFVHLGLVSSL